MPRSLPKAYAQVVDIQEKKKALVQQVCFNCTPMNFVYNDVAGQAFSGIKRTEAPRQKKEARLQGQFFPPHLGRASLS
jgi:hypothetical protein